jgi:hypothetical protein
MAAVREQFRDGAGLLAPYIFEVNHSEEDETEQTRNMSRQALTTVTTGGPKFVLQQGESTPRVLRYKGTILTLTQFDAMQAYFQACDTRTIFFRDVSGVEYEVIVTRFSPLRKRTLRNPREPTLLWFWSYTLEMEIIQ